MNQGCLDWPEWPQHSPFNQSRRFTVSARWTELNNGASPASSVVDVLGEYLSWEQPTCRPSEQYRKLSWMSVLGDRITASHSSLVGPQCGAGEREWRLERMSVCLSALNEDPKDNKPGPARVPSSAWTIRPSVKGLSLQPTSLSSKIENRLFRGDHLLRLP